MKSILLATDLAPNSDRAMGRALKIAHEHNARLYIIHVTAHYAVSKNKKWIHDFQKDTRDLIEGYLNDEKDSSGVNTEIIIKVGGDVFFHILEAAYAHKVDLIVMGMHGKEKFRDMFVGTTLERVVRKGTIPVLMVKNKPTGPYQSVLSAIDFAPGSRTSMRLAMEISPTAVFYALHAYNVPIYAVPGAYTEVECLSYEQTKKTTERAQRKIMDAFLTTERTYFTKTHKGENKRLSGLVEEGAIHEILSKKAKNLKADLITIGAHGQFGLMSKIGGTASDILSNPPCDILVASEEFDI